MNFTWKFSIFCLVFSFLRFIQCDIFQWSQNTSSVREVFLESDFFPLASCMQRRPGRSYFSPTIHLIFGPSDFTIKSPSLQWNFRQVKCLRELSVKRFASSFSMKFSGTESLSKMQRLFFNFCQIVAFFEYTAKILKFFELCHQNSSKKIHDLFYSSFFFNTLVRPTRCSV